MIHNKELFLPWRKQFLIMSHSSSKMAYCVVNIGTKWGVGWNSKRWFWFRTGLLGTSDFMPPLSASCHLTKSVGWEVLERIYEEKSLSPLDYTSRLQLVNVGVKSALILLRD